MMSVLRNRIESRTDETLLIKVIKKNKEKFKGKKIDLTNANLGA